MTEHRIVVWSSTHSEVTGLIRHPNPLTGCARDGITVWNASCIDCLAWLGEAPTEEDARRFTCEGDHEPVGIPDTFLHAEGLPDKVAKARRMWIDGASAAMIAETLKVSSNVAARWGNGRRPERFRPDDQVLQLVVEAHATASRERLDSERIDTIRQLLGHGYGPGPIAHSLGIRVRTLAEFCRQHGLHELANAAYRLEGKRRRARDKAKAVAA